VRPALTSASSPIANNTAQGPERGQQETILLLLQIILGGIAQGCVYGLVALGFVLIYKATETVNFAQGELMMLGAFLALAGMTVLHLPFWAAALLALAGMAAAGLLIERVVIRPVLGQPAFSIVMLTFGLGYVARGGITMLPGIGTETHALAAPYKGAALRFNGTVLAAEQLVIIGCTAALCIALWAAFRFTRVGIAMQASSQNQLAAYYMGIPVQRLNGLAWAMAAAVAAVAGVLLAPLTFVHANMGFIGLKAFPAAIVGGFSSLPGAIVGGLIIGVVEALSGFFLPEGFKDVMAYVVVLVMLTIKPTGLFGERIRKKV
jgi:branched-chain amino acid transport system permease protein